MFPLLRTASGLTSPLTVTHALNNFPETGGFNLRRNCYTTEIFFFPRQTFQKLLLTWFSLTGNVPENGTNPALLIRIQVGTQMQS